MIFNKIALLLFASLLVTCKKQSKNEETTTLNVDKKNMSLIAKHTWQGCPPCGGFGWRRFETLKTTYTGNEVLLAFKLGNSFRSPFKTSQAEDIFNSVRSTYDLGNATPTFHINYLKDAPESTIDDHKNSPVIANANYELSVNGNNISISTTTEFFKNTTGDYYLTPYLVVDSVIGDQSSHPDAPNTFHRLSAMEVASTLNGQNNLNGYKIATGRISEGYRVNLDFKASKDDLWKEKNISVALVLTQKHANDSISFVNAFTK